MSNDINPNSHAEFRKIGKIVLFFLALYIAINHIIRFAASGSGIQVIDTQGALANSFVRVALDSMDSFRIKTGEKFSLLSGWCPRSVEVGCQKTVQLSRTILGLN